MYTSSSSGPASPRRSKDSSASGPATRPATERIADLLAAGTAETYFVGKDAWPAGKTLGDIDRAFDYLTTGETDKPGSPGGGAGA
ncbi:MAG: hypothetical protein A2Y70_07365 [Candidatus Aminicenantes bacterium RBG_13_64_14]|nr:MAG: hypothetical protein A2Y70_07365 [Candidatus Aminicenantes bacterium RBG_13_64_14]